MNYQNNFTIEDYFTVNYGLGSRPSPMKFKLKKGNIVSLIFGIIKSFSIVVSTPDTFFSLEISIFFEASEFLSFFDYCVFIVVFLIHTYLLYCNEIIIQVKLSLIIILL